MRHKLTLIIGLLVIAMTAACNAPLTPVKELPATGVTQAGSGAQTLAVEEVVTLVPAFTQTPPTTETAGQADQPADSPTNTSTPETGTGSGPIQVDTDAFANELVQAMAMRDVDKMREMMGSSFFLAFWRSEGGVLPADQASNELRPFFAGGSAPAADLNFDTGSLLDGADPYNFLPSNVLGVRKFFVKGLSSNASDEAIVYIAKEADGSLSFYGMLVAFGGYKPQSGQEGVNEVGEKLAQAVQARNFDAMRSLMGENFSFVTLDTSLYAYSADEALNMLRQSVFAGASAPVLKFNEDVAARIGGKDPLGEWGPVAQPVRAIYGSGLGSDGAGEGVFVIGRNPDTGGYYWLGILLPKDGKHFSTSGLETVPTDVQYVMAKDDINLRAGPGTGYPLVGELFEGMVVQVRAKSAGGDWWLVHCDQSASGCWVSADPGLTEPAAKP